MTKYYDMPIAASGRDRWTLPSINDCNASEDLQELQVELEADGWEPIDRDRIIGDIDGFPFGGRVENYYRQIDERDCVSFMVVIAVN